MPNSINVFATSPFGMVQLSPDSQYLQVHHLFLGEFDCAVSLISKFELFFVNTVGLISLRSQVIFQESVMLWSWIPHIIAIERATSVYLVDRVIPMLPEVLSNDILETLEKLRDKNIRTAKSGDKDAQKIIDTTSMIEYLHFLIHYYLEYRVLLDDLVTYKGY